MLIRILIPALAALALTCGSFRYQRRGPERVVVGNLCGPKMDELCLAPVLKGGFPLAYVYDTPGVSVEGKLNIFGEDRFRAGRFLLDLLIYFAFAIAVTSAVRAVQRGRAASG